LAEKVVADAAVAEAKVAAAAAKAENAASASAVKVAAAAVAVEAQTVKAGQRTESLEYTSNAPHLLMSLTRRKNQANCIDTNLITIDDHVYSSYPASCAPRSKRSCSQAPRGSQPVLLCPNGRRALFVTAGHFHCRHF
jgi:hypothetical protein